MEQERNGAAGARTPLRSVPNDSARVTLERVAPPAAPGERTVAASAPPDAAAAGGPGRRDGVDVVLLSWRNGDKTVAALQALARSTHPDVRVVVVDNGSLDGSAEQVWAELQRLWPGALRIEQPEDLVDDRRLRQRYEATAPAHPNQLEPGPLPAVYVQSARNRGYAAGMNLGLRLCAQAQPGEFFCLLANDVVVDDDALSALVRRCRQDVRIGLCGATQRRLDEHGNVVGAVPGGVRYLPALGWSMSVRLPAEPSQREAVERRMNALQGSLVFGTRALLTTVGLMAEDRFVYFEESDWANRARRHGFALGWAPDAIVHNQHARTMVGYASSVERLEATHYLLARAGVVYTRRHHPWLLPLVVAARLVRSAEDVVRKGPSVGAHSVAGVIDAFRGRHRRFALLGDALLPTELDLDRLEPPTAETSASAATPSNGTVVVNSEPPPLH